MDGERIELTHRASDRKIFSMGALNAAKWVYKKTWFILNVRYDKLTKCLI